MARPRLAARVQNSSRLPLQLGSVWSTTTSLGRPTTQLETGNDYVYSSNLALSAEVAEWTMSMPRYAQLVVRPRPVARLPAWVDHWNDYRTCL